MTYAEFDSDACGLYYKNYDGVITTLYTSKETSMNARHRNLHSSVRRRNYAKLIFIIQATGHKFIFFYKIHSRNQLMSWLSTIPALAQYFFKS